MEEAQSTPSNRQSLEQALIDLYLNVKVRSTEDIASYNEEKLAEERSTLLTTDPFLIIEYIKTSIEILMNLRVEELVSLREHQKVLNESTTSAVTPKEPPKDYEEVIQGLEGETRTHIRVNNIFYWSLDRTAVKTAYRFYADQNRRR